MTFSFTVFNKKIPRPAWVDNPKNARRWDVQVYKAQPVWADTEQLCAVYREAHELRLKSFDVVVDHIIPLRGQYVCGLHVPNNLRIISRKYNQQISNHTYPGQRFKQLDFFGTPKYLKVGQHEFTQKCFSFN